MAVKGNPTLSLMSIANSLGIGFESASIGELTQSLRAASVPSNIVFDSPLKTKSELEFALNRKVNINADNFQELERLCLMIKNNSDYYDYYTSKIGRIGLRINSQVGAGSIATHSTGQLTSKFGVGLEDTGARDLIKEYFNQNLFLKMLHVHSGSQGMELPLLAEGIRKVVDLALEINKLRGYTQIDTIDIGGGLPVNFYSDEFTPSFKSYSDIIQELCPELFEPEPFKTVITEFGRTIFAKCGWFASLVEYVKNNGGRAIALQHVGADIAIRTIYQPTVWRLRVQVHNPMGNLISVRPSELIPQDIAGPCCIAGDIIAHKRPLPPVKSGDYIVVKDVGAYYHSSYSRYNCRQSPPVIGYEGSKFCVLQEGESIEESLRLFSKSRM